MVNSNGLLLLLVSLVSPGGVKLVRAQNCGAGLSDTNCENEFINNCWEHQCGVQNNDAQAAFDQCVVELRAGSGPIANQCTVSDCTLTGAMNAMASSTCGGGGTNPNPNPGGGGGGTTTMCDNAVTGTPATPTLCTADDASPLVYTFYPMTGEHSGTQRYFSVLNLPTAVPSGGPQPVMIMVNGYGGDSKLSSGQLSTAQRYGITLLQITSSLDDQAGGFSLEFGNDGVANDADPMPCSADDTRDFAYLTDVFAWIEARSTLLDTTRVYTRGFSQNSMFAVYTAICFADKVAGVWQGGSGLAQTGHTPIVPGAQAQCALSDALADGGTANCCSSNFCETCKYWPAYPQTCATTQPERKLTDCLMMYTDDGICGSDYYMFKAMAREGNDARLLSFAGSNPENGQGHTDPENVWSWVAGCLGLSEACSSECETTFVSTCMSNSVSPTDFASCETSLHAGSLAGCTPGCSPTLAMLMTSETPTVSLSEGKFGTSSGLQVTGGDDPLASPACSSAFGTFADTSPNNCVPPGSVVMPDFDVYPDTCLQTAATPTPTPTATLAGASTSVASTASPPMCMLPPLLMLMLA